MRNILAWPEAKIIQLTVTVSECNVMRTGQRYPEKNPTIKKSPRSLEIISTSELLKQKWSLVLFPLGLKPQQSALKFSPSLLQSGIKQQSFNARRHWWEAPAFNLACASSRATLGAQMWRYECCPSAQEVPPGPFLERWNIECDMGSNCMGSNQLATQLKETWGLQAARHMAPPDPVDVQWTNPDSCNCSLYSMELNGGQESWGGWCRRLQLKYRPQQKRFKQVFLIRALSQNVCLLHRALKRGTQECRLCVPVGRALEDTGLKQLGVQNERWKEEGSAKLVQTLEHIGAGRRQCGKTKEPTEI